MIYSKLWYLSKIGFLEALPSPASIEALEHIEHSYLEKNTVIQRPEDPVNELYFIKSGSIRFYTVDEDGKQFTYSMLGPGSTYGKIGSFSLGLEELYVETLEKTHLCTLKEDSFEYLSEKYPILLQRIVYLLGERLHEREEMMKHLALGDVRKRLIYLLQTLFNRYGKPTKNDEFYCIEFPLTQQELSNMIGVSREAVSSTLKKLSNEGLVRFPKRKKIEIHKDLAEIDPLPDYIRDMYTP
ncbi:Crp/Fnr family transcriptional regulator [Halalkalibacillus sediminis]|nr:Crp/Fnr family transcriptional regulator [Halalkalibacillus sediminis]